MSFPVLLKSFAAGIRFDIAAIVITNVFLIFFIIPGSFINNRYLIGTAEILYFTINAIALATNFIDAVFFEYIGKRSSSALIDLMTANKDVWLLIPGFVLEFWYVTLLYLLMLYSMWKFMPRLNYSILVKERLTVKKHLSQVGVFILIAGGMLLGVRGTGLKPITIVNAANYVELKYVPVVLNTPFNIIKTVENENLVELDYFKPDSLQAIYSPIHSPDSGQSFKKMNVVIFILESFSKNFCGFIGSEKGFTPNLDSILAKSLVFPNAFANGTQSYEAIASIIAGIPSLMSQPYSGSNYADNYIESLPWLLRKHGYHSSFFHGGNNGTMGFSNFSGIAGIEHYFGRNEYNNNSDYDGHWGIWDEPFLQYFSKQLDKFPQPFISTIYTLSSHHPFRVPEKYKDRFTEGRFPILKTIAYTDHSLGEFFENASGKLWFNNTLFIFTADHAAQTFAGNFADKLSIPLAFYCPGNSNLKGIDSSYCQQIDIMPSVLDYLNYPEKFFAFGESLFNPISAKRSVSHSNDIYQLIENGYILQFDGSKVTSYCRLDSLDCIIGSSYPENGSQPYLMMEKNLKAILQTYNHCLITNSATIKKTLSKDQCSLVFN